MLLCQHGIQYVCVTVSAWDPAGVCYHIGMERSRCVLSCLHWTQQVCYHVAMESSRCVLRYRHEIQQVGVTMSAWTKQVCYHVAMESSRCVTMSPWNPAGVCYHVAMESNMCVLRIPCRHGIQQVCVTMSTWNTVPVGVCVERSDGRVVNAMWTLMQDIWGSSSTICFHFHYLLRSLSKILAPENVFRFTQP